MLEKLGIRIAISCLAIWLIMQVQIFKIEIDMYIFLMIIFYAILLSVLIEVGYNILRQRVKWTYGMIGIFIITSIVGYVVLGWGLYICFMSYVFLSISIDLYREYRLTKLLNKLLDNHLSE